MPRNTFFVFRFLLLFLLIRPRAFAVSPIQERTDRFLALANAGYQALYRVNSEAPWLAVTDVTPADDADYFKPLMSWLEQQNKGRQIGWE
jgi:hypothetical protein